MLTLDRHLDRTARGLAHVVNLLDPEIIVIGGGLVALPGLVDRLPGAIARHVFADAVDIKVAAAHHGPASGVRGAARLWDERKAAGVHAMKPPVHVSDSRLLGHLFSTTAMKAIWSDEATLAGWLKVEAALASVQSALGVSFRLLPLAKRLQLPVMPAMARSGSPWQCHREGRSPAYPRHRAIEQHAGDSRPIRSLWRNNARHHGHRHGVAGA
jgi:hypothetical protein